MTGKTKVLIAALLVMTVFLGGAALFPGTEKNGGRILAEEHAKSLVRKSQEPAANDSMLYAAYLELCEAVAVDGPEGTSTRASFGGSYTEDGIFYLCVTEDDPLYRDFADKYSFVSIQKVDYPLERLEKAKARVDQYLQNYFEDSKREKKDFLEAFYGMGVNIPTNRLRIEFSENTAVFSREFDEFFELGEIAAYADAPGGYTDCVDWQPGKYVSTYWFDEDDGHMVWYGGSTGYRAYQTVGGVTHYGFTTAGHLMDPITDYVVEMYQSNSTTGPIGVMLDYQNYGSIDAAFIELYSPYVMINKCFYSGTNSGSYPNGDLIQANTWATSVQTGYPIVKVGASTYRTTSYVNDSSYSGMLGGHYYTDVVRSYPNFCSPGDSGGLVYMRNTSDTYYLPLGLIKGKDNTYSYSVKAQNVYTTLGVVPY